MNFRHGNRHTQTADCLSNPNFINPESPGGKLTKLSIGSVFDRWKEYRFGFVFACRVVMCNVIVVCFPNTYAYT